MHLRIVSLHVTWPDRWSFKALEGWLQLSSQTADIRDPGKWHIKENGAVFNTTIKSALGGGERTERASFSRASPISLSNGVTVVFRTCYEVVSCVTNFSSLSPPSSHLPFNTHLKCQLFQEPSQPHSPPIPYGWVLPHPTLRQTSPPEPNSSPLLWAGCPGAPHHMALSS